MERITIFKRSSQKGVIRLRFRLQDTERGKDATHPKGIDLYHKSQIKADVKELIHFNPDGTIVKGHHVYDKELYKQITDEIDAIKRAYKIIKEKDLIVDGEQFEEMVAKELHPEIMKIDRSEDKTLLGRFGKYIDDCMKSEVINADTYNHYQVFWHELERFLIINKKLKTTAAEFCSDDLMNFRIFLRDEYTYVEKYRGLYTGMKENNIPKKKRSQNTIVAKLKKLNAFFNAEKKETDLTSTPFEKLSKGKSREIFRTKYDIPRPLFREELLKVLETKVPIYLQEVKDAFLLECNIGSRSGDFSSLTMENVDVQDGIPFVHWMQEKGKKDEDFNEETKQPIMRYALDIIKKYEFKFKILRNITGTDGYNARIKELLKYCGIDRKCPVLNKETGKNEYFPLYEKASSKTARQTREELSKAAQISLYSTGLRKVGSKSIDHYTRMWLKDMFLLSCIGYGQPKYKVDKKLNVISEDKDGLF